MIYPSKLNPKFRNRWLVSQPAEEFLHSAWKKWAPRFQKLGWQLELGDNFLYCENGLREIYRALVNYGGSAVQVSFTLAVSEAALRDFYPFSVKDEEKRILLPIKARRDRGSVAESTVLHLRLSETLQRLETPAALCPPFDLSVPQALLFPVVTDFDWLFASQIALVSYLRGRTMRSLRAVVRGLLSARKEALRMRVAQAYSRIHPTARVHPTAVVEGSEIGAGTEVGPHCVVRFSVLGKNVSLKAGAKVEFSTVMDGSWLMHDLVLYRSHAEREVFLIHGPYQFSYFQNSSAAFATILMDYRADGRAFTVKDANAFTAGTYRGRFLGSIYQEDSKTLGGVLLAPGRIVPRGVWLSPTPEEIHQVKNPAGFKPAVPQGPRSSSSVLPILDPRTPELDRL